MEGEGFGEIVEAFVVVGALGDFEAHVVEGKAGGVGVELFLDELGEEVEGLVGVAEGEDVGVVVDGVGEADVVEDVIGEDEGIAAHVGDELVEGEVVGGVEEGEVGESGGDAGEFVEGFALVKGREGLAVEVGLIDKEASKVLTAEIWTEALV